MMLKAIRAQENKRLCQVYAKVYEIIIVYLKEGDYVESNKAIIG